MADKLTSMPVETFQKLLGLEHRIKDIWIDPYLKSVTIILDPTHQGPPEYRTIT